MAIKMGIANKTHTEILREVGSRIRAYRLQRNLSQGDLASQAGVNRTTVRDIERGNDSQLSTLLKILRVLGRLDALDSFLPEPSISPIQLMKFQGKIRQRARKRANG